MYRCKHFKIQEIVPEKTFRLEGEEECWKKFKEPFLIALDGLYDFLTEHYGAVSITINNWLWGGENNYRGYRPPDCEIGAPNGEHKNGNAADCTVIQKSDNSVIPSADIRQLILKHEEDPLILNIMRLESSVPWLHFDCKEISLHERIRVFKP